MRVIAQASFDRRFGFVGRPLRMLARMCACYNAAHFGACGAFDGV